uniref:NADH dehydrogenase subunit 6 n=1 Tax=Berghia stephanieae TaxID=1287507 RepID=A0A7S7U5G8_9GAST|nr:NADH dehydrogenase subunit 6 [Berghia stephanieae]
MEFLFFSFCFLVLCFPLFYSPMSLIGVLMAISLGFVGLLSFFGSFWYSYILFLIYVGGLLVLLIYICLVSSNFSVVINSEGFIVMLTGSLMMSLFVLFSQPLSFLGQSSWDSGSSLVHLENVSIFLFLVVLLLAMLLVVVRVSGVGSAIVANEKT